MSALWKAAKITILSAIGLLVIVVGAALGYRAYLEHVNSQAIAIHMQKSMPIGDAYSLEKARAAGDKEAVKELENIATTLRQS
jgi:hypothetical protein